MRKLSVQHTMQAIGGLLFGAGLQAATIQCGDWTIFKTFYFNIFVGGLYLAWGAIVGRVYEQEKLKRANCSD